MTQSIDLTNEAAPADGSLQTSGHGNPQPNQHMNAARILLIVPVALAFFGYQDIHVYFTNPKPLEISIGKLITNRPKAKWLRVTGGQMKMAEAVSVVDRFSQKAKEVYIPIRPESEDESSITSVLLVSTNPDLLDLADKFRVADDSPEQQLEAIKSTLLNFHLLVQEIPIEGLVTFGLGQDDRKTFNVRKKISYLIKDPIIIKDGEKPSLARGLTIIFVASLVFFILWLKTTKARTPTPPPLPKR